jgi:hypothetical protein
MYFKKKVNTLFLKKHLFPAFLSYNYDFFSQKYRLKRDGNAPRQIAFAF